MLVDEKETAMEREGETRSLSLRNDFPLLKLLRADGSGGTHPSTMEAEAG